MRRGPVRRGSARRGPLRRESVRWAWAGEACVGKDMGR